MVRLKTRYLIVEAGGTTPTRRLALQREDISTIVKDSIARAYGDYGVGMLQYAFQVLYYQPTTNLIVIRCAREQSKAVETSMVFVTAHQGQEVRFRVVRVCGSSRSCRVHLHRLTAERSLALRDHELVAAMAAEIEAIDPQ